MTTTYQTDPCLNCGPMGSEAYMKCHMALAAKVGSVPPCAQKAVQQNQQDVQNAAKDPAGTIVQGVVNALVHPIQQQLPHIMIVIGLFLFALVLVIIGFWILTSTPPTKPAGAVLRHIQKARRSKKE